MSPQLDWEQLLEETDTLSPAVVAAILDDHGKRGRKAIEAVGDRRVKRYKDFTIVVGWNQEYIVEDGRCTCPDTQYNLDQDDETQLCWHAIAVRLADGLDVVDEQDIWYSEVADFL